MPDLPRATTRIEPNALGGGGGTDLICVMAAVPANDDITPRMFSSIDALIDFHGYSEGAEYGALHVQETRKPFLFIGLPIATPGVVEAETTTGSMGSSAITVTEGSDGALAETHGVLTVISGGTVGTDQIVLGLSLDGGRTVKRVKLGTGNSYTVPYVGYTIAFGAGTLLATEGASFSWRSTAPRWDQAGIQAARLALAAGQKQARTWLVIGDLEDEDDASDVVTQANAYETANDRFVFARCSIRDRTPGEYPYSPPEETKAEFVAGMDDEFEAIAAEKRISLGFGRAAKQSPITGYRMRRSSAWAASIREYQHDVHIPTWRKADGPLSGWSLDDADGNPVEHDERIDGGALSAGFTCFRSWGNGPVGAFIAMDLTRAGEGDILSFTHNMAVANVACSTVQRATENAIGESLILNADGTAESASLNTITERVNTALSIELLQDKGEGQRASSAVWVASTDDILNIVDATLTGVLELNLRGTVVKVNTKVRVQTGG